MVLPLHDGLPTRRPPVVNTALMIACAAIWLLQLATDHAEIDAIRYGFVPFFLFEGLPPGVDIGAPPAVATLITHAFLHGDFWHLAGNMLFLWIFGNNVEDALGHVAYLGFYLFCAAAGALGEGLSDPYSQIPMIGASGAVSGVLGAYIVLFPRQPVTVLLGWFPLSLPAFMVIGLWFVMQLFDGFSGQAGAEHIAWIAHVGGFLVGVALIRPFRARLLPRPWLNRF
ncbi:rhomboid family intramembrane serine protease [Zavarzinia compransoris]|uniref:rhomboid family intramembrane serine protease n=1 Tax=Zavarzinia marina TaxID=2911065 RepID=UPI001F3DAC24|nr:rhomboid family intramembrane serine protease [Zavarzinia marina]MCF4165804.1 rhomboid family intramembrane serine protease [Zavarzinia marina]